MKLTTTIKHSARGKYVTAVILLAVGLLAISSLFSASGVEAVTGSLATTPASFSQLAEMASPSVVNIRTVKTIKGGGRVLRQFRGPSDKDDPMQDFFKKFFGENHPRDFKQRSLGSGFIIHKDGYIVTNNHVVENADKIEVILENEKEYEAEIIGRDPNTDLALLKIKTERDLPELKFGDSDALKVGQWVMAIGNPFGLDHTVTAGIVSAKGRVIGSGPYDDFIQTDASINPGNSGGPLLNMQGEVIGINTAIIASGQGIGFAIPVNLAKGVIDQLRESGEVTRGWLGVGIQDLSPEVAEYYGMEEKKGALVTEVFPGDPADLAGIEPRDVIVAVNGKRVESTRDLTRTIANIRVGQVAKIKVLRGGKTKTFKATITKREDGKILAQKSRKEHKNKLGIRVAELTPEMARRYNVKEGEGVIVAGVDSNSQAKTKGLRVGDLIKEVNHQAIKSVEDFNKTIDAVKEGEIVNIFARRPNRGFLVIKITK
ncbi:MAG: DegQ family serine endoprotease [Candidatus Desulfatibia sp.]|uniref:DegQ family serine endoprotease n=1 Tax=Candidatus Desulfatibia sp. TaxID=3101189 RepID=UPI002F33E824